MRDNVGVPAADTTTTASDVSVCLLFILSIDRYLRIAYPFRKRFSKVIIHLAFLVTWPLSAFLCVYYYYWRSIDHRGTGLCLGLGDPPFPVVVSTIVVNMFGMFLIPVIGIISVSYTHLTLPTIYSV